MLPSSLEVMTSSSRTSSVAMGQPDGIGSASDSAAASPQLDLRHHSQTDSRSSSQIDSRTSPVLEGRLDDTGSGPGSSASTLLPSVHKEFVAAMIANLPEIASTDPIVDPYEALSLQRSAQQAEIDSAYASKAVLHHPDLNALTDTQASREFHKLSQAYWTLSDPDRRQNFDQWGNIDQHGFDIKAVQELWLQDVLLNDGEIDELIESTLPFQTESECLEQFMSIHVVVSGRRRSRGSMQCMLCGYEASDAGQMFQHFGSTHNLAAADWAEGRAMQAKEAFAGFALAATGIQSRSFTLPDGSQARFKGVDWLPDTHWSGEEELDRALGTAKDATSSEAVAASLERLPNDVVNVLEGVQAVSPALLTFLAPLPGSERFLGLMKGSMPASLSGSAATSPLLASRQSPTRQTATGR